MRPPRHPTLIARQRQARLRQLGRVKPFVAASLVTIARQCGNSACRCATGEGHPGWYLTAPVEGTTRTVYIPQARLAEVRQWVEAYHEVKRLLREISMLSLTLLAAQARVRRAQRARR